MSRRQKGRRPRWDALHRANDTEGRTEVLRLDGLMDEAGDFPADEIPQVHLGLADRLCSDPTPKLDGALDLAAER